MAICSCTLISFLIVISMGLSNAHTFYIGGDDGWTLKPSEDYSRWAKRNRFLINDSIVFKYMKGHNSVLIVNENGYNKCNKDAPFLSFKDGNSTFKFDKSGTFYFISGHEHYCEKGQKVIIVVLSEHHHTATTTTTMLLPPSPQHTPTNKAPSYSPSPSPTKAPTNNAPSHSPSPIQAPTNNAPSHSPSPIQAPTNNAPSHSPSPIQAPKNNAPSHSPSPIQAPKNNAPSHSPSPSNNESPSTPSPTPNQAPTHLMTPSPAAKPPPNEAPSSPTPSPLPSPNNTDASLQPDEKHNAPAFTPHYAPAPAPSAAPSVDVSFIGLMAYTLVFSTLVSIVNH